MSILEEIQAEVDASTEKHGDQSHLPLGTGPKTTLFAGWTAEQTARAAKHRTDTAAEVGRVTWLEILTEEWAEAGEATGAELRAELVQVAAVAVKMIDAIDKKGKARG